jgi:hypothetical protein
MAKLCMNGDGARERSNHDLRTQEADATKRYCNLRLPPRLLRRFPSALPLARSHCRELARLHQLADVPAGLKSESRPRAEMNTRRIMDGAHARLQKPVPSLQLLVLLLDALHAIHNLQQSLLQLFRLSARSQPSFCPVSWRSATPTPTASSPPRLMGGKEGGGREVEGRRKEGRGKREEGTHCISARLAFSPNRSSSSLVRLGDMVRASSGA